MFAWIKFAIILANSKTVHIAIIGSDGPGGLVFDRLISFNTIKILAGAIHAITLALFIDVPFQR